MVKDGEGLTRIVSFIGNIISGLFKITIIVLLAVSLASNYEIKKLMLTVVVNVIIFVIGLLQFIGLKNFTYTLGEVA